MADKNGNKTGGRKKGTPNKRSQDVQQILEAQKCDPIKGMARIAEGDADCFVCTDGKVSYAQFCKFMGIKAPSSWADEEAGEIEHAATADMTCPACGGTGRAVVDTKQRADMYKELAQYIAPKRKATEISGQLDTTPHEEWLQNLK